MGPKAPSPFPNNLLKDLPLTQLVIDKWEGYKQVDDAMEVVNKSEHPRSALGQGGMEWGGMQVPSM